MRLLERISLRLAAHAMLLFAAAALTFHALIVRGVIPYDIVWGGNLESASSMHEFEAVSLGINLLLFLAVLIRVGYIRPWLPEKALSVLLWMFAVIFLANTIGNLLAKTMLEMLLFTPITLVSSVFCARLAIGRDQETRKGEA